MTANTIREAIANRKTRSAWERGVVAYTDEIIDTISNYDDRTEIDEDSICNSRMFERAALNGASDWSEYSAGGCSMIYDGDIAARLCAPYELKLTRNGERRPNRRETWLDVQARALFQAARLVWQTVEQIRHREAAEAAEAEAVAEELESVV